MQTEHISEWGKGYGLPCQTVDGNDVQVVHEAARAAVAQIRETGKPFLLETMTYRQRGHYSGDNEAHISDAERATWLERDPIARWQSQLLAQGQLQASDLKGLKDEALARIEEALAQAQAAPYPSADELLTDVYA